MILKYLFDRLISLLGLVILSLVKLATVDHLQEYNDTVIYPDKVRLNCYYYRNYSFWKDIQMIFCTVLGRKMAYAGERI